VQPALAAAAALPKRRPGSCRHAARPARQPLWGGRAQPQALRHTRPQLAAPALLGRCHRGQLLPPPRLLPRPPPSGVSAALAPCWALHPGPLSWQAPRPPPHRQRRPQRRHVPQLPLASLRPGFAAGASPPLLPLHQRLRNHLRQRQQSHPC
jgi:hypothetical protein